MDYDSFQRDLQAARLRGAQFQQRALEAVEGAAPLPEALEELSTALEELRVTDEPLRAQQEQLAEARQTVESERDQYCDLFEAAPAAYLVTDRVGVIQQANQRAAGLLVSPSRPWSAGCSRCSWSPRTAGRFGTD
jgi:PAS domain-containing protein